MPTPFEKLSHPEQGAAVTPHATNPLPNAGLLYIGGDGNVAVTTSGGSDITFIGVKAGSFLPVKISHVKVSGTTATNLLVLY
jgi:hypothetical protein